MGESGPEMAGSMNAMPRSTPSAIAASTLSTNDVTTRPATLGSSWRGANWVTTTLAGALNEAGLTVEQSRVAPDALAQLLVLIDDDTISGKIAKNVFAAMWQGEGSAEQIIERDGLRQITDSGAIDAVVEQVLSAHAPQVEQFRAGKEQVLGFLVGKVMQQTQGKANPAKVNQMLRDKLKAGS